MKTRGAGQAPGATRPDASQKGMERIRTGAPLSERRAEAAGDTRPQVGFRRRCRDVHARIEQAVDQGADDFGAVEDLPVPASNVRGEAIEVEDLAIEEHH